MTLTASRPSQQELERIYAQMVRSRNGIDMNSDGAKAAYQQAMPVLFEEITWLRAQYATAHATLAEAVPVEADDQEDLARFTAAVVALWRLQEQGLYAKPAMAKLKQQNDDLRDRINALTAQVSFLQESVSVQDEMIAGLRRSSAHMAEEHRVQVAGWERLQLETAAKRHDLEAELEQAHQDQRDLKMACQRELATRDAAHKEHAQRILALLVEAHGLLAEDAA